MKFFLKSAVSTLVFALAFTGSIAFGQSSALTLTVSSTAVTIHPGDQNVPVTVTVAGGASTVPVVVTLTGLPTGITVPPLVLNGAGSGTLNLSATVAADQEDFPNTNLGISSATRTITAVAVAGSTEVTVPITLTVSLSNPSFVPAAASINLPIVSINTSGVAITSTDTKVEGTISITSADGQTTYLPNSSDTDDTLAIQIHGNTTSVMPKKAYEFKLGTSVDLLGTMGLSCPYIKGSSTPICDKSKTYVLLANYDDKTLLRDWAASALANAIPIGNGYLDSPADSPTPSGTSALMPWAPHSLYVELYLNGAYQGSYQLIEKVNVDSHRINITELSESDTSAADVTGGYLMEIDQRKDETFVFTTPQGVPIGLQDPDFSPDPEVPAQTSYIQSYVDDAENALFGANYTDPTQGWRAYFDEASAVNFYIVNELMGNNDGGAFYSSDYLYKDVNNPLIYMGPVWDFDISSGNVYYNAISNPSVPWMQVYAAWYKQWFTDPGFKADVATQWNALRNNGVISNWLSSIQKQAAALQQTQVNNQGRWPMQGIMVWPNSEAVGSYDGEVAYLMNYLNARASYLDSILNNKPTTTTTVTPPAGTVRNGTAATFSAHVTASSGAPSGTVTFLISSSNYSNLVVGTVDGSGNATATISNLLAGTDSVEAIYSGDSEHAMSVSDVVSFTALAAQANTTTVLAAANATGSPFTVTVLANSGTAVPTGTVAFTSNGQSIGTASLSAAGIATFVPAASLPIGSDTIQASYGGDTNYLPSTSNTIAVTAATPDFTLNWLGVPPGIITASGNSATFNMVVGSENGFSQAVTFACSGQPADDTCTFSPSTVTPSGQPVTVAVTVTSSGATAALRPGLPLWSRVGGGIAVALLLWPVRRRKAWLMVAIAAVVSLGVVVSGCGGSSSKSTALASYPLTVTATSGTLSHATTVTIDGLK